MTQQYPKRLIEIDLPIKRISAHARREKSIRHGHISTLHIWWARRPLAACRAVICAALWPDPADPLCPQDFRDRASKLITEFATAAVTDRALGESCDHQTWVKWQKLVKAGGFNGDNQAHWNLLRFALLDFIADFANWDNSVRKEYLTASRALTQAAHEALGGEHGTRPLVLDPFAGGGSIPLEALRIGADVFAGDLNPIPVLLNKVTLEYLPKYGSQLSEDVRRWGAFIKKQARKSLARYFPKDPDGATPIAYLWARTVLSESPTGGDLPVQIPLLRSMWLSKRRGNLRALRWVRNSRGQVKTEVAEVQLSGKKQRVRLPILEVFTPANHSEVEPGTARAGAAVCPVTAFTTSPKRVKEQLKDQHGGAASARLYAVYVDRAGVREFRLSTEADRHVYQAASNLARKTASENPAAFPSELINPIRPYKNTRGLSAVTRIGCKSFIDLYNGRQALAIYTFYEALKNLRREKHFQSDRILADAIQTTLAFAIDRSVSQNTSVSRWDPTRLTIKGAFSKQALAVVWDFAEANPFSGGTSDWDGAIEWICRFFDANADLPAPGTAARASATKAVLPSDSAAALVTDPPYFAAIPYGDLSDFYYVWLRRGIRTTYPDLFTDDLTDKDDELIVTNAQKTPEGRAKDDTFFREGMACALSAARDAVQSTGIGVVVYAEGTTAGWEAILGAIIDSQWVVTSSWPIDTEMQTRTQAHGAASLQSSIHIVCRPRANSHPHRADDVGDWRDVLQELPTRIHQWMPRLAEEGVVGADAIFACLGPALEIYSRHPHVEKANGERVALRDYLEQVWAAVAKEALAMVFKGADATGFEADARLTAMWLWTLKAPDSAASTESDEEEEDADDDSETGGKKNKKGGLRLEYDAARKIAQGLGAHLENLRHLVEVAGDEARLLPVAERTEYLFGKIDREETRAVSRKKQSEQLDMFAELTESSDKEAVWNERTVKRVGDTALDRVHQSMILFAADRGQALRRFIVEEGIGRDGKFWRLAQALSALYPAASDEKRWVDGVLARKKQFGF